MRALTGVMPRANVLTRVFLTLDGLVPDPSDMYFGLTLWLRGVPPRLADIRDRVADRVPQLPALTAHLVHQGAQPQWEPDPGFDLDQHLWQLPDSEMGPLPAQALLRADHGRLGWALILASGRDEWSLHYLVHHRTQDAIAAIHTLRALLADDSGRRGVPVGRVGRTRRVVGLAALVPELARTFREPAIWPFPPDPPSSVRRLGQGCVELDALRAVMTATGATVNQVHLTAMAAALGRWTDSGGDRLDVLMPLDTRLPDEPENGMGNRFGLIHVGLSCGPTSPVDRLRAVVAASDRRRVTRLRDGWRELTERVPERVAGWAVRRVTDPARIAVTLSTVSVREPMSVFDTAVTSIAAIPWLPPGLAVFSLLVNYRDQANLSVLTHAGMPDPQELVELWALAVAELYHSYAG